jgi:hypothetical protein
MKNHRKTGIFVPRSRLPCSQRRDVGLIYRASWPQHNASAYPDGMNDKQARDMQL